MATSDEGDIFLKLVIIIFIQTTVTSDLISENITQDSGRWSTSVFGACSAECGEGVQTRTVRCVGSVHMNGKSKEAEVPESFCPLPSPQGTRPCSKNVCIGHWKKGEWSECSVMCGTGTRTRQVKCETTSLNNQSYQLSSPLCPGLKPKVLRQCHTPDCSEDGTSKLSYILSENYTLIQTHKTKRITVNVGGKLNLIPGQTVVVKCRVKHFNKHLVHWSRGYRLVPFMGRVKTIPGGLRIENANPSTDTGVYSCIAGDLTATVTVEFLDKDDPVAEMYKKLVKNSKCQHPKHAIHHKSNGVYKDKTDISRSGPGPLDKQINQCPNSRHFLMYLTQEWSSCNATCRSEGQQTRQVTCSHVTPKYVKIIPDLECSSVGLTKPETTRSCSAGMNCAVWRPGAWSQCRPSCGQNGKMYRILSCVWALTDQPAWTACDVKDKPVTSKPCKTRPCPLECKDNTRFCSLASLLKLCRYHYFKQDCCRTCQK